MFVKVIYRCTACTARGRKTIKFPGKLKYTNCYTMFDVQINSLMKKKKELRRYTPYRYPLRQIIFCCSDIECIFRFANKFFKTC